MQENNIKLLEKLKIFYFNFSYYLTPENLFISLGERSFMAQSKIKKDSIAYYIFHRTLFGYFALASSDKGLIKSNLPGISEPDFLKSLNKVGYTEINKKINQILEKTCIQLDEYLQGIRKKFDIPFDLDNQGTVFQSKVWKVLSTIPYGKTLSYKDVAIKINNLSAVRAVGQANKANPLAIFIPCHRVIGSNKNDLVGYAGKDPKNLILKAKLLEIESPIILSKFLI